MNFLSFITNYVNGTKGKLVTALGHDVIDDDVTPYRRSAVCDTILLGNRIAYEEICMNVLFFLNYQVHKLGLFGSFFRPMLYRLSAVRFCRNFRNYLVNGTILRKDVFNVKYILNVPTSFI